MTTVMEDVFREEKKMPNSQVSAAATSDSDVGQVPPILNHDGRTTINWQDGTEDQHLDAESGRFDPSNPLREIEHCGCVVGS